MTGPDRIDMDPAATQAIMAALLATATTLHADWTASIGQIAALDSQLGGGPLGRAIAADYNAAVQAIRDGADQTVTRVGQLGEVGTEIVRMYTDTDGRTGQYFGF
jgi:hypothetical protein